MVPSVIHVSGTITGDVEVRLTQNGTAVCRFRLTQTPTQWDTTTHKWRDGTPIPYICTAWRDLAHNATTSLADGTNILATGHITEIRNNTIYLTTDDLGISLRKRTTDTNPPTPLTAHPAIAPPTPQPTAVSCPATGQPDSPPPWWTQKETSRQTQPGPSSAAADEHHTRRPLAPPFDRPCAAPARQPVLRPARLPEVHPLRPPEGSVGANTLRPLPVRDHHR